MKKLEFIALSFFICLLACNNLPQQKRSTNANPADTSTHSAKTLAVSTNKQPTDSTKKSDTTAVINSKPASSTSTWKTYKNSNYHFSFQYPPSWNQKGKIATSKNLKGEITSIELTFSTQGNNIQFNLTYYPSPNGEKLYEYALRQFKNSQGNYASGSKKINIGGQSAIIAHYSTKQDGKGHLLKQPLKTTLVKFLGKNNKGEFQIKFATASQSETNNFNELLKSFRFIE